MFGSEINILKMLEAARTDFFNIFFEVVTMLGEETLFVLLIAIIYYAFNKKLAHRFLFITMLSLGINAVIKNIVRVPRPFTRGITCLRGETATGYSFPSGHTQSFASWSMAISYYLKSRGFIIISAFLAILLGFSRMYLGAHYLSDVLAGLFLGWACAILGNIIFDKAKNNTKLYFSLFLILTPFAIGFLLKPDVLFEDFFKFYGMLGAFVLSVMFEERFCPIEYSVSSFKQILRVIMGVLLALVIKIMLGKISVKGATLLLVYDTASYFILVMAVFGFLPYIFKKLNI